MRNDMKLPVYNESLLNGQRPKYLLICCADSRQPGEELLTGFDFKPGYVFTIRNAGNCYLFNLETFYYGVSHLRVEKVLVCGHNDCGMIKAVLKGKDENPYIQKAIDIIRHDIFGGRLPADEVDELAKENVHRQIEMMMEDDVVKNAMRNDTTKEIVGLYYDFSNGKPDLYIINRNGERMEEKAEWGKLREVL